MQITDNIHAFMWQSMTANNCNTYLIDGPMRILIDPGHADLFDHVRSGLGTLGLGLEDIALVICTHGHPDHLEAVERFKGTPALFAIHETEWSFIRAIERHMRPSWSMSRNFPSPDFFLKEGQLEIGGATFHIFHTPGHSPGSICIHWPDERVLFTGDLVFREGIGRTDLPGGNGSQLKTSVRQIGGLDVDWLLCGHGEPVSGRQQVKRTFEQIEQFWFAYV